MILKLVSPLEQFEIINYLGLTFIYDGIEYDLSITNQTLTLLLISFFLFNLVHFLSIHPHFFNFEYKAFLDEIFSFIKLLINENLENFYKIRYFVIIFFIFLFILINNLIGMIPYTFTPTSHLIFTGGLSFMAFTTGTLIGFLRNGLRFFQLFLPPGAPFIIAPFLIIIEIISYFARVFSLAIRLFANIMAGHTLLKILTSFCWIMLCTGIFAAILQLIPLAIVFGVTILEIMIGALQAYVFTILVIIYFNDAFSLH